MSSPGPCRIFENAITNTSTANFSPNIPSPSNRPLLMFYSYPANIGPSSVANAGIVDRSEPVRPYTLQPQRSLLNIRTHRLGSIDSPGIHTKQKQKQSSQACDDADRRQRRALPFPLGTKQLVGSVQAHAPHRSISSILFPSEPPMSAAQLLESMTLYRGRNIVEAMGNLGIEDAETRQVCC